MVDLLELERVKEEYQRLERRGIPMSVREWYERKLEELRAELRGHRHGKPLGEILVEMGVMEQEKVARALSQQRAMGRGLLLGEILLQKGWISLEDLHRALQIQAAAGSAK